MLYVLVVIHNRTCAESKACQSLKAQEPGDFQIIIYDNSDTDIGVKKECAENGWNYLGGNGNKGLSIAYNCVLDRLKAEKAEGFICILDDDTRLGQAFCTDMIAETSNCEASILLPVMMNKDRILSPWRETGRKYFRTYGECASEPQNNLLAFNSGMLVSLDVFSEYRYNETLFLDCVDISFLNDMKKRGRKITVIPVFCEQSFSGAERLPAAAAMKRFGIYYNDMLAYYGTNDLKCRYTLLKRAAHLALVYGSTRPFAILYGK